MTFHSTLDRIRRWRRCGRWLTALLAGVALAGLLLLTAGLADAWLAMEPSPRTVWVLATMAVLAVALVWGLVKASIFSRQRSATTADELLGSTRRPATASLSLDPNAAETPLARHLAERAQAAAAAEVAAIPVSRILPWKSLRMAAAACVLVAIPIGVIALTNPDATRAVVQRLMNPAADLRPWSPLHFQLDAPKLAAVYGGELPLAVTVTGGNLDFPVEVMVRRPGSSEVQRLPSFRESSTRFSRTLDTLTEPVSIAFACGKARSEWMPVELLLQPKVLAGKISISPPAYTGRTQVASAPLDTSEIAALEGSSVALELTSNRPLAPSVLVFLPATLPGVEAVPQEIPGEISPTGSIIFRWTATIPGKLSALLRDVRGTPAAAPLELTMKALPDQAPFVDLSSPPRYLLATPSSVLRLAGRAEDDHALSKVQIVRTLQGFRDRARVVAPVLQDKAYDFADKVDLADLGVSPGQVIELFLEANDHNPSLLGQGASEISRIQIISEDEYAARLRAKTTLEEFSARYAAIARAMQEAAESLKDLEKAVAAKDPEAIEKERKDAAAAHEQAAELLGALAKDFPAFELEKRLNELAEKATEDALENLAQLEKFDPQAPAPKQLGDVKEMQQRLGANEKQQQQLQADAQKVAEAGQLLEMAARFQQLYKAQESLSKRIRGIAEEILRGNDQNRRLLIPLADTQEKNRQALDEFDAELQRRAEAIKDPDLADMAESAMNFLQELRLADPQSAMRSSTKAGQQGVANDAYVQAELARSLMENLMKNEDESFAQACQGNPQFKPGTPDVNATMEQLLEALMAQNPGNAPGMTPSQGQGAGGLGAGGSGPGSSGSGFSMPDVAMLGPQRLLFEPQGMGGSADGTGESKPGNPPATAAETETLTPAELPRETRSAPNPESVPEPYREAVKLYFDHEG
jgi:hypothetical protein